MDTELFRKLKQSLGIKTFRSISVTESLGNKITDEIECQWMQNNAQEGKQPKLYIHGNGFL